MRITKRHYRLFLASPGDVEAERNTVEEVVKNFNLDEGKGVHIDVIRWEDHATPGFGRPQEVIFENTDFKNTDIFIGIFWSRMGTPGGKINPGTGKEYLSGSLEEIQAALNLIAIGKLTLGRFMIYFCERPIPHDDLKKINQAKSVLEFREEFNKNKNVFYRSFISLDNFKFKFHIDLEKVIKDIESQIIQYPPISPPQLSSELEKSKAGSIVSRLRLGPIVNKMCDRIPHVNDFWKFFQTKLKECPGRPQFYFIHGDEGECHASFIYRLSKTCIKEHAEKVWGEEYGSVYFKTITWPHSGDLSKRITNLEMNLINELANGYTETDYSVNALIQLPSLNGHPLVIIEHNIYASRWDKLNEQLIEYYLGEYWTKLKCKNDTPLFLNFFNIEYRKKRQRSWRRRIFIRNKNTKEHIKEQLHHIIKSADKRCPCSLIEELKPVTIEDVKEWFSLYEIYEDEWKRQEEINSIFKENDQMVKIKSMVEIEKRLEKIIEPYYQERIG